MATVNSIEDLVNLMKVRHKQMDNDLSMRFSRVVHETVIDAREQLTGGISTKKLRQMGHPYARAQVGISSAAKARRKDISRRVKAVLGTRRGTIAQLPINRQTGKLVRGQFLSHTKRGREEVYTYGFSGVEYAKWVLARQGTRKMKPRGFWLYVRQRFFHHARAAAFGRTKYSVEG